MAAEPDAEPAARVEGPRGLDRSPDHRRECAAHLCRRHAFRQRAPERYLREQVEGAEPVCQRTPDSGKAPVGCDQPFEYGCVPRRSLVDTTRQLLPGGHLLATDIEDVEEHRMD